MKTNQNRVFSLLVCFISFSVCFQPHKLPEFPFEYSTQSLVSSDFYSQIQSQIITKTCLDEIELMMNNFSQPEYENLLMYSGKDLNSLGSYTLCEESKNSYIVINVQCEKIFYLYRYGLCLPSGCTFYDYTAIGKSVEEYLNKQHIVQLGNTTVTVDSMYFHMYDLYNNSGPLATLFISLWIILLFISSMGIFIFRKQIPQEDYILDTEPNSEFFLQEGERSVNKSFIENSRESLSIQHIDIIIQIYILTTAKKTKKM